MSRNPALRALAAVLVLSSAPALAGPAELLWRTEAEAMEVAGSLAPPAILDASRADFPTSLASEERPSVEIQVRESMPLSMRRGNAERGSIRSDGRELRLSVPLAQDGGSPWHIGWRVADGDERWYRRLRWNDTSLDAEWRERTLGVAWSNDRWTLGAARTQADLSGRFTGRTVAKLQHVGMGREGVTLAGGGALDTVAVEHRAGRWLAGLQLSERDANAGLPVVAEGRDYLGAFTYRQRRLNAWLTLGDGHGQWFAWASDSSLDPGPNAIFAGRAIRGRMELSAGASAFGVGLRRELPAATTHLELSHHEHALDLSGWLDRGALGGGLTGRYRAKATARARTWVARVARERRHERWRWRWGLSAAWSELDIYGRYVDSAGPLRRPLHQWEQKLTDGEASLAGVTLGAGYDAEDWRIDATGLMLAGDMSAHFEDLTATPPPPQPRSGPAQFPTEPLPSGPGARLSPGWIITVRVSHSL